MANKPQKSIKYPGLPDTYTFVQIGTEAGQAADAKVVGDVAAKLDVIRTGYGKNLYNPDTNIAGYTINASGIVTASPQWCISEWIPVEPSTTYYIKVFANTGDFQGVRYAQYKADKTTLVQRVIGNTTDYYKYFTNADTEWIRLIIPNPATTDYEYTKVMVVKTTVEPTVFVDYYTAYDKTARDMVTDNSVITFRNQDFQTGYIYYSKASSSVVIGEDTNYYHSPMIAVEPGRAVKITDGYIAGYQIAVFYDCEQNYLESARDATTSVGYSEKSFVVPAGARYMQYSTTYANANTTKAIYTDTRLISAESDYLWNQMESATYGRAFSICSQVKSLTPRFSLVDDDTTSFALVKRYHDICAEKGVVGNYATITFRLDDDPNLVDLLKSYEAEGFGVYYHCNVQSDIYRTGNYRDNVAMELDFVTGLRKMRTFGFLNYNLWIAPYGITDETSKRMAIRHGMIARFSNANHTYVKNEPEFTRYQIPRCDMGTSDTGVANIKATVDECVANGGWLIITTHVNTWGDGTENDDRLKEVIQYCLDKGMLNRNLAEAFQSYMPLYNYYEMH